MPVLRLVTKCRHVELARLKRILANCMPQLRQLAVSSIRQHKRMGVALSESSTCLDAPSDVDFVGLASDVSDSDSEDVEDAEGLTDTRSCQPNVCLAYVGSIRKLVGFCPLCGSPVLPSNVQLRFEGTMLYVLL